MYKEIIIVVVIILFIGGMNFITQNYSHKKINETIDNLSQLKNELKQENNNQFDLIADINTFYDIWDESHSIFAYYIEHDELEKVETELVASKSQIEEAEYKLAITQIDRTIYILNHIADKYDFSLENIF